LQVLPGVCQSYPAVDGVGPVGGETGSEQSPAVKACNDSDYTVMVGIL